MFMKKIFSIAICTINLSYAFSQNMMDSLIYAIRDPQTQKTAFRESLEKIGELLAYDIKETLPTCEASITTLTGHKATHNLLLGNPVLVTILRAGLPLNHGVMKVFKEADVGFIAMARDELSLKSRIDYVAMPEMTNKVVILTDTMLATGGSLIDAIHLIKEKSPSKIYIVAAIASQPGIDRIMKAHPDVYIVAGCIDPALNEKGYIIPGLGDAGDRAYGKKS